MQVSLKKEEREKPASSRKCTKCKGKAPQTLRGKNLKLDKKEKVFVTLKKSLVNLSIQVLPKSGKSEGFPKGVGVHGRERGTCLGRKIHTHSNAKF